MRKQFFILVFFAVCLGTATPTCRAETRYYMIMLAWQGEPNLPRNAHTFALFAKASTEGKDPTKYKIESHCISWMPRSLMIDALRLQPEHGENLTLAASLKVAKSFNARVSYWGPFLIKKECYDMALKRFELLNSGKVAYVVLDRRFRGGEATNCIHAVSDLDTTQPFLLSGAAHGEASSLMALRHLQKWVIPSKEDASWLVDRLGLQKDQVRVFPTVKSSN